VDVVFTNTAPAAPAAFAVATPASMAMKVSGTSITFSRPINPASITINVRSQTPAAEADEDRPVAGSVVYEPKTRTATWRPANPLVPLTKYALSAQAKDTRGRALKAVIWAVTGPKLNVGRHRPSVPEPSRKAPTATAPQDATRIPRRNAAIPTGK
jgi:hypothetical protein